MGFLRSQPILVVGIGNISSALGITGELFAVPSESCTKELIGLPIASYVMAKPDKLRALSVV